MRFCDLFLDYKIMLKGKVDKMEGFASVEKVNYGCDFCCYIGCVYRYYCI